MSNTQKTTPESLKDSGDLATYDVDTWIDHWGIKNEKGDPIEWLKHQFLIDIYNDQSNNLVVMKPAQVGLSTLEVLKNIRDAEKQKMDIIYCVDEETEILTQRGFLRQENLQLDDVIATLSKQGRTQWSKLQEIFRKDVDMECIEFAARNFNALVTPNHRWLLQPYRGSGQMFFRETKDMIGKHARIPKSVNDNGLEFEQFYTNEEVALLAWIFAEGHYPKQTKGSGKKCYSIIIVQSEKVNAPYCDEIRNIFRILNVQWKEYPMKHSGCVSFRFAFKMGKEIRERFSEKIPDAKFALSLTKAQCKLFIETFVKADGWIDRSGTLAITQKNKQTTDIICMIAVLGGYSPSVVKPSVNGCYTLRMTQFSSVETNELKPKKVNYKGIIWCPRTPYGTFYARRNGRCYWTGNTLPTDGDVGKFVGGKVNRIIANNPHLEALTADKDSIELKQIGSSMIYFMGTWTKKAAIMITADRLVHDEKDSSKQDVIADYQARLQHSKFKQTHVFSHPSVPNSGVDMEWKLSDKKEWFIKCPHCERKQILTWNTEDPEKMSIDFNSKEFVCKKCHGILDWHARAKGEWLAKKGCENAKWSGYHISLLMAPWMSAKDIINKYNEVVEGKQTMDFFYNKILGLPYAGSGNSVTEDMIIGAVTTDKNLYPGRMIIGVDTGIQLRYVYGNKQGLLGYGQMKDYMPDSVNKLALNQTLEYFLKTFPDSIMIVDQGGDIIGSRKLREKYPGRVYLCHYARDRKTMQLIRWGEKDEYGNVLVDRNRMIQVVVDEYREKRIKLYRGRPEDWHEYWLHWSHIYRTKEEDTLGVPRYVWMRSDRDDWVHCLSGETKITTKDGDKEIKNIKKGDFVLTRKGWNEVEEKILTNESSEVYEMELSNGIKIISTLNHKFYTNRGFIPLRDITMYDILEGISSNKYICKSKSSQKQSKDLTVRFIENISAKDIFVEAKVKDCIGSFGNIIKEKFQKVSTFTTKMKIPSTIPLKILNWLKLASTCQSIPLKAKQSIYAQYVEKNIGRKMSETISIVQSDVDLEYIIKNIIKLKEYVLCAVINLLQILILEESLAQKNVRVVGFQKLKERISVYNLSVKDCHEYYANGILVANSTVYWRVGVDRFAGRGGIVGIDLTPEVDSYLLNPDMTVDFDPHAMFGKQETNELPWWAKDEEGDWRDQ